MKPTPFKVGDTIEHIPTGDTYAFSREDYRGNIFGYKHGRHIEQNLGPRECLKLA